MTRPPIIRAFLGDDEIIVDLFAGGGGASTGIHRATGRSPDIAINNHSPEAIAIHAGASWLPFRPLGVTYGVGGRLSREAVWP